MTLAHALFKSALFLTVGVIDHATGTRDLRTLSGLGRRLPVLATIGGLAALSMAGVPPLLGFVGKEAAFTALLDGGLPDPTAAAVELAVIVARLGPDRRLRAPVLVGRVRAKQGRPDPAPAELVHRPGPLFLAAPALLAVAGLLAGPASPLLEPLVAGYAETLPLLAPEAEKLGALARLAARARCCRRSPCSAVRRCSPPAGRSSGCSGGSPSERPPTRATGT